MNKLIAYIIVSVFLSVALAIPNANASESVKEVPTHHEFKIKFSQKVDAYQLERHKNIALKCSKAVAFTVTQLNAKTVKVISKEPLPEKSTCTVTVDAFAKSSSGKTLLKQSSQKFLIKDAPKTALHSNDKLVKKLKASYKVNESNNLVIYGAKGTTKKDLEDLQSAYTNVMRSILPYFPEITKAKHKPVIVMLKTDEDLKNYKKIGGVVMNNAAAWITNDNIIVVKSAATPTLKHEYLHWMFTNVYKVDLPLWIDEGVTGIFTNLYRPIELTETIMDHFPDYPYYIFKDFDKKNLYRAHTPESTAIILKMLEEKGVLSFHNMLIDARKTSLDQAWKKHYGVVPSKSEVYITKMQKEYVSYLKEQGLDYDGLMAYNKKSKLLPIWDKAFEFDLHAFNNYKMYETKLFRIYVAPEIKGPGLQKIIDYGNKLNAANYKYRTVIIIGRDKHPEIFTQKLLDTIRAHTGVSFYSETIVEKLDYDYESGLSSAKRDLDRIHERFQ